MIITHIRGLFTPLLTTHELPITRITMKRWKIGSDRALCQQPL